MCLFTHVCGQRQRDRSNNPNTNKMWSVDEKHTFINKHLFTLWSANMWWWTGSQWRTMEKRLNTEKRYKNTCKKRPTYRRGERCDINLYHSLSPYNTSAAGYHCWPMVNFLNSTITNLQEYFQRVVQNAIFLVHRVELSCKERHWTLGGRIDSWPTWGSNRTLNKITMLLNWKHSFLPFS